MDITIGLEPADRAEIGEQLSSLHELQHQQQVLVILAEAVHRANERVLDVEQKSVLVDDVVHLLHFDNLALRHEFQCHPFVAHFVLRQLHLAECARS